MDKKEEENKNIENNQINEIKIDENIISSSENKNEIILNDKINSSSIIESIFEFDKESKLSFYPKINKENFIKLLDIFGKGKFPKFDMKNDLIEFVKEKIILMKQLKEIIQNKYEILSIINKFFKKNNFSFIEYFIDLYFESLNSLHSDNHIADIMEQKLLDNEIIKDLIDIINWLLSCGLAEKKNYDYIFQQLAALQLSKKLDIGKFCEYLNLLLIFYGKQYDIKYKKNLIAKNYVYFYDKQKSGIITNILEHKNCIETNDGISIFLWFYLIDNNIDENDECILAELTINDDNSLKVILDNKFDISVKFKGNLLSCKDNNAFNIPIKKWVQLKIQIMKKQIMLNLFNENKDSLIEEETGENDFLFLKEKNLKYEKKIYSVDDIPNNNFIIKSINFFKNYFGFVGTIIFCRDRNIKENVNLTKTESGLINNKIYPFLSETPIFGNYFIFSPNLFVNDKNMFIDSSNNINGTIINDEKNEFNGVFKYKNFKNNIYLFGGVENILPLFEIFYKLHENISPKEEEFLYLIFKKLIKLLEIVLINKRNCLEALNMTNSFNNNSFFLTLQLFLEFINEKFFQKDNEILDSLLNIGKYIYTNFFKEKNAYFFQNILFSHTIVIKFNLSQQELLWKFFDQGKNQKFKVNLSDFKKIFMPLNFLNKFLISLNQKYINEKKEIPLLGNSLMNIIKVILEDKDTKEADREIPLLLCKFKNLNENIIKGIIQIYNSYLNIKEKNVKGDAEQNNNINNNIKEQKESDEYIQKTNFVNYILSSNNNYVELLLALLSCNFRTTKKAIIKFFQILILKYGEILENYFLNIDNSIKKGKNIGKINKEKFYLFLEKNLALNHFVKNIPKKIGKETSINDSLNSINLNNSKDPIKQHEEIFIKSKRKNSFDFHCKIIMASDDDDKNSKKNKKRKLSLKNNDIKKIKTNLEKNFEIFNVYFKEEKILFVENNINQLEKNIKINIDISNILVELLIHYHSPNKNIISSDNANNGGMKNFILQRSKTITNKTNTYDEEKILDLLVTFLINNRELEVVNNILFLILNTKFINSTFSHLLDYFSHTNTKFIQLIEEILIITYLYLNDEKYENKNIFIFIKDGTKKSDLQNEEDYFNNIYLKASELLISLFFHKNNIDKFKILNVLFNIILKISNKNKNENLSTEENKIYNLSLKLYEELLEEVSSIFYKMLNDNKKKDLNKSDEKPTPQKSKNMAKDNAIDNSANYYSLLKYYFEFIPYLLEYYALKNYSNIYQNEIYKKYEMKIISGFPEYFNLKNADNINLYYNFAQTCFDFFNINKYLEDKKFSSLNLENEELFIFKEDYETKMIIDYMLGKEYKDEIQFKITLLLKKNISILEKNFFTIVEIMTIFNNYYIEKFLLNEDIFNSGHNTKNNFNITFFFNFHQFFIINIIIISCKIKENETYPSINKTYKEIQDILFNCLEFNIANLIQNSAIKTNKYSIYFTSIFVNIYTLIWKLYENIKEKNGKINFKQTCVKNLLESFNSKNNIFFHPKNLIIWSKKPFEEKTKIYEQNKTIIVDTILPRYPKDRINNPIIDLFSPKKFIEIYKSRKNEYESLILLLKNKEDIFESIDIFSYQDMKINIRTLLTPYEPKTFFYENLINGKRRNNYRKIKKKLYSWNYSYSNLDVFYKNNSERLKFKISNFLSKDLSRRLLVPILDFDYYTPKYKSFDYEHYLFKTSKNNSEINQYDELYRIDLKIFGSSYHYYTPSNNNNFCMEEICYIKTNHHINGYIFFSIKEPFKIHFAAKAPKNEKLLNDPNYDSDNKRCFGSIFSGEFNQKEKEMYLILSLKDINFIFIRKYCFRNNSIEIFSKDNRSYYFKFLDYKKRNQFLDNLISKANKFNLRKYTFKSIKGFDEFNKSQIIGYYKDSDEVKPYSSLSSIAELWRNCKISTFEYLMWINIYGNRSYQDISQYPVFPWLLINYESKKFETLISKSQNIRDLRLPMGMLYFDQKGKERQENYLESYKIMIMDLYSQNIIKIKMKDEDCNDELYSSSSEKPNKKKEEEILNNNNNFNDVEETPNKVNESVVIITPQNINPSIADKINDEKLPKFLDYNLNLDKYYFNLNVPYDNLPYIYGSHFSNAMYVSHYLCRLFPYSYTAVEIQGGSFDVGDRLFINLQNSISSAVGEKGDLRELIPDLFILPELFMNINNLELGFSKNKEINDVNMPTWCLNNPYFFVEKHRTLLECGYLNINGWIDLIFGINQRGKTAQNIGNVFLPFSYDGVLNFRLKPEDLLKNRDESEYKIRLFEMGVHPTKVFDKKCKGEKIKFEEQIILKKTEPFDKGLFYEIKLDTKFKNVINFTIKNSLLEEIYIIDKSFIEKKLIIQENKETKSYSIKEISAKKEFPFSKYIQRNIEYKLIFKQIFQNEVFIVTGLFDGELHLYLNTNKTEHNSDKYELLIDTSYKKFDKSAITYLVVDKNEKYIICGTLKGSIIIYSLSESLYKEGKKEFISLLKFFPSHPGYTINYISFNSNLNLIADCSYDGYVNIYSVPKFSLVRSIYIDPNTENGLYNLDFVFLSAQPLGSITVYSNEVGNFKSFTLNGNEINVQGNNEKLNMESDENGEKISLTGMVSPLIFTDYQFNDYLIYILNNKYIFINKFPTMQMVGYIECCCKRSTYLTNLCVSTNLKYIYIYDELNNKIYVVQQKNKKIGH